jgi:beta-glucanase (GH16 family)
MDVRPIPASLNLASEIDLQFTADKSGQTVNVTNRAQQYHDYTFAWTPEQIVWLVDGVPVRTVSKEDTASGWFDKTYRFPRTPARVRLS